MNFYIQLLNLMSKYKNPDDKLYFYFENYILLK